MAQHDMTNGSHHPPRIGLAALACLQTALFGAIILGWASIEGTLVVAPKKDGGAGLSLQDSARLFSIASSSNMLSCLILGFVLDKFGPRTCSMISTLLIGAGCQIVSFSDTPFQYYVGFCVIAIGGPGVTSSVFHITNLFPKRKFLVMSIFNGTTNISFCILALFDWLWQEFGVSIQTLFRWYTIAALLSSVASWFLLPDKPFEDTDEKSSTSSNKAVSMDQPTQQQEFEQQTTNLHVSESYQYTYLALQKGNQELVSLKDQPFWNQVRSGTYLRSLFAVVVTIFCCNFYVASIAIELADERKFTAEQQHQLSSYLTYAMSWVGFFGAIFVGWLMDRIGLEWCTAISLLLGQLHMLFLLFWGDSISGMLVGFGVYTMFRQFLFPAFLGTVSARLGFKHFGILVGLALTTCGVIQLFMSPLVQVAQGSCHRLGGEGESETCSEGFWKQLHLAQLVLLFVLLYIPIIDYQVEHSRKRRIKTILDTMSKKIIYGSVDDV